MAKPWIKVCAYGVPGTGKTSFGVSAPKPLILLSEHQALINVRDAATRLGRPMPVVLAMDSLEDYRDVIRAFGGPRDRPFRVASRDGSVAYEGEWPESVVLDSITDACELVEAEIRRESPPEKAKDGLERWTERHWAALRDRSEKLIRAFRDVPAHVVYLALSDDRTVGEGDEQQRVVQPALPMRALPAQLAAAVNVVGITSRKFADRGEDGQRVIEYEIRTVGPQHYMLKPYRPLRDIEVPDFSSWVERLRAASMPGDDLSQAQSAPEPSKPKRRKGEPITETLEPAE